MPEPTVNITMKITQTECLNRGIGDVMRNVSLMQNGDLVLDYESFGGGAGMYHGTVVGKWTVTDE